MKSYFTEITSRLKLSASLLSIALGVSFGGCAVDADDLTSDEGVESDFGGTSAELAEGDESSCLANVTNFGSRGPFRYKSRRVGRINMQIPTVPDGCKVPVAHLANGTGATCGIYQSVLNTLASHGFLTTCYENANTGAGQQGLEALETAVREYPNLAAKKFASLGHSQGGQASFVVLQLAEQKWGDSAIYAGLAMQPASGFGDQPKGASWQTVYGRIKSPMFMFSGTADILVSELWVRMGFGALNRNTEAYHWSARGATHIPTPNGETSEVAVPWFRWKLLGDNNACRAFKALKSGRRWTQKQVQNEVNCD